PIVSVALTYIVSYLLIPQLGDGTLCWKLSTVITCGTLAGAIIPELVKIFTSVESRHVREIVISSREGGASLNILSGFVAGNFSAYWLGLSIVSLMTIAYYVSTTGLAVLMVAPAVFGATTMIFSIIVALTGGLTHDVGNLSILYPPFLLGLITGGAVIYWFTGASAQAVTTGAYRAVEFIKAHIRLEGVEKASVAD